MSVVRRIGGTPHVTLWHVGGCAQSQLVRRGLLATGVHFDAVEVHAEPALRAELEAATGQRDAPALVVDGAPIVGMDRIVQVLAGLGRGGSDGDLRRSA